MPRALAIVLFAVFLTACHAAPPAVTLYVSPTGSDSWSGERPAASASGDDGPLATLAAARDRLRALRDAGRLDGPVRVLVRGGVYRLSEPLVLEPRDSGTPDAPLTYAAYGDENPVVSGGRRVTGWQVRPDGTWVADLPQARNSGWVFRELYVNGRRRTLARTPNEGFLRMAGKASPVTDPVTGQETDSSKTAFRFAPGDIPPGLILRGAEVCVYYHWETAILPIGRLDRSSSTIHLAGASKWAFTEQGGMQRYFIQNTRSALDAPGEFWLDRRAGRLYYKPLPGESPQTAEVVAPVTQQLVILAGRPDEKSCVENVVFEGLAFEHAGLALEPEGHGDWQAACTIPAVFQADGARNCQVLNCRLAHLGMYGVWFRRGCQGNTVQGCEVTDTGCGGVRIGEPGRPLTPETETSRNTVASNFIHDGGIIFPGAVGVWVGHANNTRVIHNEICDMFYTAISCGWSWGYSPTGQYDNEIAYNHLHHLGRGLMSDMGAIYTLGVSPGTTVHHNLIHDVWCFPEGYGAGGIYPDEGSSGIIIENNVVYDTISGGFTLHYGEGNTVRNNIFAFGRDHQVVRGRNEEHLAFDFQRNIVLFSSGDTWSAGGNNRNWTSDSNLFWDTRRQPLRFPGASNLAEWQAQGFDEHSIVADPQFVDAARRDFRLRRTSPALKLGFVPIDLREVGLTGPPELVARARAIKRAPVVFPARPEVKPMSVDDGFETSALRTTATGATTWGETAEATIRVTDETAATGARSLKFTDAPGVDQPYNPHLWYNPYHKTGVTHLHFALRFEPGAKFAHEWREWYSDPFHSGPSLKVTPDGKLMARETELMDLPASTWIAFDISFGLGPQATGRYQLTVTLPGSAPRVFRDLPCDPEMKELTWIGFISDATDHAVFYIDDVRLESRRR